MTVATVRLPAPRRTIALLSLLPILVLTFVVHFSVPAKASPAVTYVSNSSKSNDKSKSLKIDTPSGIESGDVMLAAVYVRGDPHFTSPGGWTFIRRNGHGRLYYRIADGTEADSYKWKFSERKCNGGSIVVYRGVDTSNPINDDTGHKDNDGKSIKAPSATTTVSSAMIVAFYGIGEDSHTSPASGFTERIDRRTKGNGKHINWEVSEKVQATASRTGDEIATATDKAWNVGQLLALPPSDSGGGGGSGGGGSGGSDPYRAFSDGSYWNTALPADAPIDPKSGSFISYLVSNSSLDFIDVGGSDCSGAWGNAVYWPQATDPLYDVTSSRWALPPQFSSLRIPKGAQPSLDSDAEMILIDLPDGYVADVWQAKYDSATDSWTAGGGGVYYTPSNGLEGTLSESDDSRNTGHRGFPPSSMMARWDEIQAGVIQHVLRLAIPNPSNSYVFPMSGTDGSSTDASAPPEGARMRLKTSIDLDSMGLSAAAYALAKAAQDYGFVIGDGAGGVVTTGLENTVAEGKGCLWPGVLDWQSLDMFPLSDYEVIQLGYGQ